MNDATNKVIDSMRRRIERTSAKEGVSVEELFDAECRRVDFMKLYGNTINGARYGIYTFLSEQEMYAKYSAQLARYSPFIILPIKFGAVFLESERNDEKHARRMRFCGYFDPLSEISLQRNCNPNEDTVFDDFIRRSESGELMALIKKLPKNQRIRVIKHYFLGYLLCEIASEEGVSVSAISQSLSDARKKLKKMILKKHD